MHDLQQDPDRDDDTETDDLAQEHRSLRGVSDLLLSQIDTLRHLELEARKVPPGTPEFERISHEITVRAREVFAAAGEQERLATQLDGPAQPIDESGDASG